MRNLKRALSLGLTATMISGLMVMGSSAASYADVTSKQNEEAIEVLKTVGIMVGDENGKFNPEAKVTRNEMAVVMCNLLDYTVASYKGTSPFTDVPEWAEPYVAACYTNGITSGYDTKTYGGSDTVTTGQAALMLLKALGYFQYSADFGSDWLVETTKNGSTAGLFDGVATGAKEALTRNDVAQMVLNALEADLVKAEKNGSDVQVGDIVISGGKATYDSRTGTDSKYAKIDNTKVDGKYTIQLGEDLYDGDLVKADGADDDFGRPSVKWTYENKEIGTYADDADAVYTATVEKQDLYDLVGSDVYNDLKNGDADFTVVVDGVEYLEAAEPVEVFWRITEPGQAKLDSDKPTERLRALLEEDAAYAVIYKRILALCAAENGAATPVINGKVDNDPLVQKPRLYAPHFVDKLEQCDALEWRKAWFTTETGKQGLEMLADVVDESAADSKED